MPPILTIVDTVQCPHLGSAVLTTSNTSLLAGGNPALLQSDQPIIAGCTFNVSGAPCPCVSILWTSGAQMLTVAGTPVVLATSVGLCCNAAGAPQGPALILSSNPEVESL